MNRHCSAFPRWAVAGRVATLGVLLVSLTACYSPAGPQPEAAYPRQAPDYSYQQVEQRVMWETRQLYQPITTQADMPPQCQYLNYNHFGPRVAQPLQPRLADAVVVLMPGMLSGANALTHLAQELVYHADLQQRHLQVVVVERRNQCLNDLTGMNAAELAGNVQVAVDYYYGDAEIGGRRFEGFLAPRQVGFLVEFGLARVVEDFHAVAVHLLPDVTERRNKLFIGGHSLGGNITTAYMGWDFDGQRDTHDDGV